MSLRPSGETMHSILKDFKGTPWVHHLPLGLELPEGLVVLHEHTDHYSLQTTEPITLAGERKATPCSPLSSPSLAEFNSRLTAFLKSCRRMSREEFFQEDDEINDQNN